MAKRITKLKLTEISSVDNPAMPHATMSIMKRHDPLGGIIKKYYGDIISNDVKDFRELLNIEEKNKKLWEAREELYPILDAFRQTVNNIVVDANLSLDAKMAQIESNVTNFVAAVREKVPDVEEELTKFFKDAGFSSTTQTDNTENKPVSDENVTKIADLEKTVTELTKKLEEAEVVAKMTDAEKEYVSALSDKEKIAWTNMDADQRSKKMSAMKKNDETLEVDGQTISKAIVGDTQFSLYKRMVETEARVAKAEGEVEMANLRKRADDEFGNVVGSADDKAALLKALKSAGGDVEAYGLKVLKAANEIEAFVTVGKSKVEKVDNLKKRNEVISEIAKRDNIPEHRAMAKAAAEHPDLFAQE